MLYTLAMRKRLFDIAVASSALIVVGMPMAMLYAAIKMNMGSNTIFKQKRLGKDGELFNIYKFRSMTDSHDDEGSLLPDSKRITPLGRFIRSRGIDELPQLFNVLKGDMSIVGPRPRPHLPINDDDLIVLQHPEILDVNPGIASSRKVEEIAIGQKLPLEDILALDIKDSQKDWSLLGDFNLVMKVLPVLSGSNPHEYKNKIINKNNEDVLNLDS